MKIDKKLNFKMHNLVIFVTLVCTLSFRYIIALDKRYGVMDFISCLLMSIGLTFFILAGSTIQPNFNYIGESEKLFVNNVIVEHFVSCTASSLETVCHFLCFSPRRYHNDESSLVFRCCNWECTREVNEII